jgi:16S rRNA (guanine(966)-N(2))-methyltransferase RsmD
MSSRVIAGTAKGHRLQLVSGDSTRPITDKVKEALFNILGTAVVDSNFLDLFAGTGAVGIEALSRGAAYTLFTELNKLALKTIHSNLESTRLKDHAEVRMVDAFELMKHLPPRIFDIIFIAPPQYKGMWLDILRALDNNPAWLSLNTIVVVQIDPKEQQDVYFEHLRAYDQRRYGRTLLWFFETMLEEED